MEIIGRQIELGVGVENVRGTAQTVAEKWLKKISATIIEKIEKVADESTRNRLEESLGARIVRKWIEGGLEGVAHADAIGYLIYNLYGAVSTSALGGGVYNHTFSISNAIQHASLSLFCKEGSVYQQVYSNGMLKSLEINATTDEHVKFSAEFLAAQASANADTPTYATEYDWISKDVVVKIAATEGGLPGATALKAKSVNVKWETGAIPDFVVGQYHPDDIYNAKMAIDVDLELNLDDTTFKALFTGDTYRYMSVTVTGTADLGGGNFPTLTLILNRVQVLNWERDDSADDLIVQKVSLKAFYNETDSEQSTLALRNKTAEYDAPITA